MKDFNEEDLEFVETHEWLDSLEYVLQNSGPKRVEELLDELETYAHKAGVEIPFSAKTPYINTIPVDKQHPFPGSIEIEKRIRSLIRWNAMAMVVRANREEDGIGGHISTYASAATLYEVAFNHFFKSENGDQEGDVIYFQGHAAPGIYSRAFLEGRLSIEKLKNFRRELKSGGGLSSYPHPWLMPNFWSFPTVSMGLGPIMSIYQARFNRYLEDRGLKPKGDGKVWAFLGDGETDEPETLGAISLAAREKLDNLIFVINCNLQRLDGPVRGNGKIIQELEAVFRGAGWNVIKVVWGNEWDALLEKDNDDLLVKTMTDTLDGEYQKYIVEDGKYIREKFFGKHPKLLELVKNYSDEELSKMRRGGHEAEKVYTAYRYAVENKGAPTVIIAKTIKGYGLGESGEGKNITHSQKKLNEEELKTFRTRFGIPISDKDIEDIPFYKPPEDSIEMKYLKEKRKKLGGYVPERKVKSQPLKTPEKELFLEFHKGTNGKEVSTTMAFVRILTKLLRHTEIGKLIVPIIPDEARTFGMEALFRQVGIYSHVGQLYEPVDADTLLYYKEAKDGQILEEGITEAGAMSSFIAAGTAYSTHGINTIPFFIYYSMFGFQRIGDLVWAAGDMRTKGFLIGGTSGRTTLAGEGLQHQDGHSHLLAYPVPNVMTYDPAFAFELAIIIRDGIYRMYEKQEDIFYYITVMNDNYVMPAIPEGENLEEGVLKGLYKFKKSDLTGEDTEVHLLGSGAILNETLKAQKILEEEYGISTDVWSMTSYKNIHLDCLDTERWNMFNPTKKEKKSYLQTLFENEKDGVYVFASDYVQILSDSLAKHIPGTTVSLGTYGYGRSESRSSLRDFFEVDAKHIVFSALSTLKRKNKISGDVVKKAIKDLDITPDKIDPKYS